MSETPRTWNRATLPGGTPCYVVTVPLAALAPDPRRARSGMVRVIVYRSAPALGGLASVLWHMNVDRDVKVTMGPVVDVACADRLSAILMMLVTAPGSYPGTPALRRTMRRAEERGVPRLSFNSSVLADALHQRSYEDPLAHREPGRTALAMHAKREGFLVSPEKVFEHGSARCRAIFFANLQSGGWRRLEAVWPNG